MLECLHLLNRLETIIEQVCQLRDLVLNVLVESLHLLLKIVHLFVGCEEVFSSTAQVQLIFVVLRLRVEELMDILSLELVRLDRCLSCSCGLGVLRMEQAIDALLRDLGSHVLMIFEQ